jgi:hypothetical protein
LSSRRPTLAASLYAHFPVGTFSAYLAERFGEYADARVWFVIIDAQDDRDMRGEDGLSEVEPVEKKQSQGHAAAMDKRFQAFDPHQVLLLPQSLDDWLPQDHQAQFVADLIDDVLDPGPILADYTEKRGYPPYDPGLMLRLLIYGYTTGVRSSRAIKRKCANDVAFRYLVADQARTSARSRGSTAATFTPSRTCSPSPCTSRPSSIWSR